MNMDVTFEETNHDMEADFGEVQVVGAPGGDVDLTGYVKKTDVATKDTAGIVKAGLGLSMAGDSIQVEYARENQIALKNSWRNPLVPAFIDYVVKAGITTNQLQLTDAEKQAAKAWLGVTENGGGGGAEWKLVTDITLEEDVASIAINTDMEGNTFTSLGYSELFIRYKLLGHGSGNYTSRYSNLEIWFNGSWSGGYNAAFANAGNGYDEVVGSVHALYPKDTTGFTASRLGIAVSNISGVKAFNGGAALQSVNLRTIAGLKAGSQIVIYGR